MAFEVISLVVLVIATLGWCFTETEWGKNFTKKNPVITSVSKLLFNFIHAH